MLLTSHIQDNYSRHARPIDTASSSVAHYKLADRNLERP